MRIGDLAARTDASVRSLRYYEEQGLLVSERSASGQRLYAEDSVEHVLMLKQLYAAGLTSRVIAEVLPCTYRPSIETNQHAFDRMVAEREKLATHIADLTGTLAALDTIIGKNRAWRAQQDAQAASIVA